MRSAVGPKGCGVGLSCLHSAIMSSRMSGAMSGCTNSGCRWSIQNSSVRSASVTSSAVERSACSTGCISRCRYGSSVESRAGSVRHSSSSSSRTAGWCAVACARMSEWSSEGSSGKNSL